MSIRTLPGAPTGRPSADVRAHFSPLALQRWDSGVRAASDDADRSISIYDVIGYDYWTGDGVTAKRIAGALRSLGKGPVTVNINSPGGDLFEGLAIYNLLREHDGEVIVRILGLAASAASIIAMAGDNIQIGRAAFLMIHNAWVMAIGNRHDLRDVAEQMEPFDAAMADIYAARTGSDAESMAKLMDAETWIGGSAAVEQGFATELLASDQIGEDGEKAKASAVRRLEAALRASMPKAEAVRLISDFKSSLRAGGDPGDPGATGAGDPTDAALSALRSFHFSNIN